ncbi:hypothetical protein D3C85_1669690 [compost metagenome]
MNPLLLLPGDQGTLRFRSVNTVLGDVNAFIELLTNLFFNTFSFKYVLQYTTPLLQFLML